MRERSRHMPLSGIVNGEFVVQCRGDVRSGKATMASITAHNNFGYRAERRSISCRLGAGHGASVACVARERTIDVARAARSFDRAGPQPPILRHVMLNR